MWKELTLFAYQSYPIMTSPYEYNVMDTRYMPRHISIEHLTCIMVKHDELKNYFHGNDLYLKIGEYYDVLNGKYR